jgi:hypothetical protein
MGGALRVKNGFQLSDQDAAKAFHYRCIMLNLPFSAGLTFGELAAQARVEHDWNTYVEARPENPKQPWGVWRRDAQRAVSYLRSSELAEQPVRLVCECQLLLQPYLDGRKKSHLLYKVVRAESDVQLHAQFAMDESKHAQHTYAEAQERELRKIQKVIEDGEDLWKALYDASRDGMLLAVQELLTQADIKVNQADNSGVTPLYKASAKGHVDTVQALLAHADIQVNQANNNGLTPLYMASQEGHVDTVQTLLAHADIQVNQAANDGWTPLMVARQLGHVDTVQALLAHAEIQDNSNGL